MGCCSSCLGREDPSSSETEMQNRDASNRKSLSIARGMTAPSIEVQDGTKVSGYGLALVGAAIEQDAAYFEAHIELESGSQEVLFGVATKKDQKFYRALEEQEEDSPEAQGTSLMKKIKVSKDDVIGIAVQQADLPMVQFLLNGEPLHELAVNRFRGTVFPAVYLPENDGLSVKLEFNESQFLQVSPHARFGPLIIARGII